MGLLLLLVITVIVLLAIGTLTYTARMGTPGGAPSRAVPRLVQLGALIGAVVTAVIGLIALVTIAAAGPITMTMPVQGFLPMIAPELREVSGPDATIIGGSGFTEGNFTIEGLDPAARLWLAAGTLVNTADIVTILLLIARLARQASEEAPFARSTSALLARGGAVLAIGGLIWQICFAVAGLLASNQALFVSGYAVDDEAVLIRNELLGLDPSGLPSPGGDVTIDLWPIGIGLVLIVLAVLMRHAERLQRDTAGLV